jgi:hypothetical protein
VQTCNKCRDVVVALIRISEVSVSIHVSEAGCVENVRGFSNSHHAGARIVSYLRVELCGIRPSQFNVHCYPALRLCITYTEMKRSYISQKANSGTYRPARKEKMFVLLL